MFVIDVTKEEVLSDFPEIKSWMRRLKSLRLKDGELDKSKIEFYYSYGFFIPKVENKMEYYQTILEKTSKMLYEERLVHEMSKVRVNLTLEIDNFIISDRMPNGVIPEVIRNIVEEVTKVKMMIESEYYKYKDVIDSIPPMDSEYVDIKIIRDVVNKDYSNDINFDVDSILDKIYKKGFESITDEEKKFLDEKSKDM